MALQRTFLYLFFILATSIPLTAAANVFEVRNVRVDVTSDNAVKAREEAFSKAQEKGFRILANRLLSEPEKESFKMPPLSTISTMIEDFEVTNEQLSDVRYVATYHFNFRSDAVRSFIGGQDVAYSDVKSKPVLILPFFEIHANATIWGEQNPWREAWNRVRTNDGLVPVIVPIGDARDFADINDNSIFNYNPASLSSMQDRYNAGEAMIVSAKPNGGVAENPDSISVYIYRTDRGRAELLNNFSVTQSDRRGNQTLYDAGVRKVRGLLQSAWKSQTAVNAGQADKLRAMVTFRDVGEWVETQRVLRNVQGVEDIKIISLKPGRAEIDLLYKGDVDRLQLALSQANITLRAVGGFQQVQNRQENFNRYPNPYHNQVHSYDHVMSQQPTTYELYLNKFRF